MENAVPHPAFHRYLQGFRERGVAALLVELMTSNRRFLLCAVPLGTAIALAVSISIHNRYEATTRLMPPSSRPTSGAVLLRQLTSGGAGAASLRRGIRSGYNPGSLFIAILRSRTVQDRLVERFGLQRIYGTQRSLDARNTLAEHTEIEEDTRSGVITISVTEKEPRLASAIADAYSEELNRVLTGLGESSAHRERVFFEARLREVKQELDDTEQQFSRFSSKNTAINIEQQSRAMIDTAAAVEGELIATEAEISEWEQIYSSKNVRVASARARAAELRNRLQEMTDESAPVAPGSASASSFPNIHHLPLLGVRYAELYHRIRTLEAVYLTLTREYEVMKVEEVRDIHTARVLDVADLPERQESPRRLRILVFGTAFSFASALVLLLGRARWEQLPHGDLRKVAVQAVSESLEMRAQKYAWLRKVRRTRAAEPRDEGGA